MAFALKEKLWLVWLVPLLPALFEVAGPILT